MSAPRTEGFIKAISSTTFKILLGYVWRLKRDFIGRIILNGLGTLLINLPILMIRNLVADVFDTGDLVALSWYLVFMLLFVLVSGLLNYGSGVLNARMGERLIYNLRTDLYLSLQRQSFAYFDENRTGDIMSKLTSDVEQTRNFLVHTLMQLLSSILQIGIAIGLMTSLSWELTLAIVPICVAIYVMIIDFRRRIRPLYRRVREEYGKLNSVLQENVTGVRVVRAFAKEKREVEKFSGQNWEFLNSNMGIIRLNAVFGPAMDLIGNLSLIVLVMFGAYLAFEVPSSSVSIAGLISFFIFIQLILGQVKFLAHFVTSYQQMIAAGDRLVGILTRTSEITEKTNAIKLPPVMGRLRYANVSFVYPGTQRKVLKDIDFTISPGEKIAILGSTGSGKSTLINLLPRFYDVTDGAIFLDDIDLRDVKIKSLRTQVGIVAQDTFLFNISIKDNIIFGNIKASQQEIEDAAKIANIHDFIMSLPEGYNTIVGERGISLSGGQRQRIAIARTLLMNPTVLVFDDSLSAVDVETEYLIQQALRRVMLGRTTLIITQRLSSIRDADKIIYIDNGHLVEMGTHAELMGRDGYYSRLYKTLFREQAKHLEALDAYTKEREVEHIPPSLEMLVPETADTLSKTEREKIRDQRKQDKEAQKRAQKLEEAKRRLETIKQKEEDRKQKEEEHEQEILLRREAKKKEDIEKWFERDTRASTQDHPDQKDTDDAKEKDAKVNSEDHVVDDDSNLHRGSTKLKGGNKR